MAGMLANPRLSEPWKGEAPRATCNEDLMLLLSIADCTFMVTICLIINGLYENSQGVSHPSLGSVLGLTEIVIDFFQALVLN